MAGTQFAGQAELATAQARDVLPMPDNPSFEEGAAFPVSYGTGYAALMIMGGLRAENRVLIHSAAGGVGIAATQIARNTEAEIFATASAAKHPQPSRLRGCIIPSTTAAKTSRPKFVGSPTVKVSTS